MSEITSQATYAVKLYADGELVTERGLADYVLAQTWGDQAVIRNRQSDRWAISIGDNTALAHRIERKGFVAFTKLHNGTGVSWA